MEGSTCSHGRSGSMHHQPPTAPNSERIIETTKVFRLSNLRLMSTMTGSAASDETFQSVPLSPT